MSDITDTFGDLYEKYVAGTEPVTIPLNLIKFGSFRPRTNAGMEKIRASINTTKGQQFNGIIPDR